MDFENQKMLETMFNARQTRRLLRRELANDPGIMHTTARSPRGTRSSPAGVRQHARVGNQA